MCDVLRGTITVGRAFNYTADWTIPFGDFDQLLLGTYNLARWMHLPASSTRGTSSYGKNARYVFGTSLNPSPHNAYMLISDGTPGLQRPLFDIGGGPMFYGQLIYRESDKIEQYWTNDNGGMAVWVRQSNPTWCRICQPHTYNSIVGWSGDCTRCPDNSQAPAFGNTNRNACRCNAGYFGANGGPCLACPVGTYNSQIGVATCIPCPVTTTSLPASLMCQCKTGSTGPDNGPCTACPVGTYKGVIGPSACQTCLPNTRAISAGSTRCQCELGLLGIGVVFAHEISPHTLRAPRVVTLGSSHTRQSHSTANLRDHSPVSLRGHPPNTRTDTFTYTVANGYNKVSLVSENYRAEAQIHVKLNGVELVLPVKSASERCGHAIVVTTACTPESIITVSYFAGEGVIGARLSLRVEEEAVDVVDCVSCPAGFIVSSIDGMCVTCGENTYNPTPTGLECIACPMETRSPPGSSDLTHCKCRGEENGTSGLTGPDGGFCEVCPEEYYKTIVGSGSCDKITNVSHAVSFDHVLGTPVRSILGRSFRGNWSIGDQVRIHHKGTRGYNDVVLRFLPTVGRANSWVPSNLNPLLKLHDKYMFKVQARTLIQKNVTESGFALRA